MTGKELLEQLKAMTPEELEREVVTRHWETGEDGDYEAYVTDTRAQATVVLARDVPLLSFGAHRDAQIPVIEIS